MPEQKNIIIPLDEKSESILVEIIRKHKLIENDNDAFEKVKEHKPFNENIVIQLTRDLMMEKISNIEFLDALHKELNISKEATKNIALDIINNLIPLLEKIPEDQLEDYNRKKQLEEEKKIEEEEDRRQQESIKRLAEIKILTTMNI